MTDATNSSSLPQLRSGPLIVGGVLAGAGIMLVLAGVTIGSAHLIAATRQWVREMEVPPSERARQQWARAKAAALAGASAWQDGGGTSVAAGE
jgi:hypothetical protein